MPMIANRIIQAGELILGSPKQFDVEERCIIGMCFFTAAGLFISVIFNFLIGLSWQIVTAVFIFSIIFTALYYRTRIQHRFQYIFEALLLSGCSLFILSWFFNAGIAGPALNIAVITVCVINLIATPKQRNLTIMVLLVLVTILLILQYYHSSLIIDYQNRLNWFIDYHFSFVITLIIITVITRYIMDCFRVEQEKSRLTEEKLKQSEYLFRTLAETTSTAIMMYQDGSYIYANPAAERLTGYPLDELKTLNIWDLVHQNYQDQARRISKMREMGLDAESGYEIMITTKSGKNKWIFIEASTTEYYGKYAGLIAGIDISKLKETEQDIIKLRGFLSNIINSMPSVLIGVDWDLNVTQWNLQAEKLTGITADNAISKPLTKVVPLLDFQMETIKKTVCSQQTLSPFRIYDHHEKDRRHLDLTVYPLKGQGDQGAVIRIDDVTEKVRLEELIVQSEKMLSVGGLAAGMAHEINNPLAGMMQSAQVAKNRLTQDLEANRKAALESGTKLSAIRDYAGKRDILKQLDNIGKAGTHAAKIVKNMLSFARKPDAEISRHNLLTIIDQTLKLAQNDYNLKKQYDFKQINIVYQVDPYLPEVLCEPNKLVQVFFNIIKNAAEAMYLEPFTERKPTLIFRLRREETMARIEIEDNGPGMPETIRKRIFEPFFTTKEVDKGTGLGLSVSYFIVVENHNGEMNVESSPGAGSRFIIKLPLNPPLIQNEQ